MVALGCPLVVVQLPCGWVFAAPAGPAVRWSLFMSCVGPRARAVRAEAAFCRGRLGADCSVRGCRERIRARPTLLCVSLLVLWERKSQFMTRGSTVQSWPASSLRFCLGALRTAVINPKRQNLLHRTVRRRYIPRSCNGSTKRSLYDRCHPTSCIAELQCCETVARDTKRCVRSAKRPTVRRHAAQTRAPVPRHRC